MVTAPSLPVTEVPSVVGNQRGRRLLGTVVVFIAICILGALLGNEVPTWLDAHVKPWTDDRYQWIVQHRQSFWLFNRGTRPFGDAMETATNGVERLLFALRWTGVLALFAMIGLRTGGLLRAIAATVLIGACGVLGFWSETMTTLSLIIVSVGISLLIGVPLGVWTGLSPKVELALRPLLDIAQVMPAYVYLLPVAVLFGIGIPAAVVATVIYAVPPAVRLTSHGLRSVPVVHTEVGLAAGCTPSQLLWKVQLPSAARAVLLGLNQVIMMAFGIIVIAALVGTEGLGREVLNGLQKVKVGISALPGLALVCCAIAIDRISSSPPKKRVDPLPWLRTKMGFLCLLWGVVAVAVVSKLLGTHTFPPSWTVHFSRDIDLAIDWLDAHIRKGVPVVGGTNAISDWMVTTLLTPLRDLFLAAPWWLIIAIIGAIAFASKGIKLALGCTACMVIIAALRVWDLAMDTFSQVTVVVLLSVAIALPIGVLAGRSDRADALIKPLLDAAQVLPTFVYLVPVIALFRVGRVPGIIASIVYALPPCIRLTSLGLREASTTAREAARAFGATSRQELLKVQVPLALRSVMLGINQTIMMALSMVIVAALVGAGALGLETINGLTRSEIGRGLAGGLAIVALAVVLDRITQAWGTERAAAGPARR